MTHFAWKSKRESNFKNRGQQRTAIVKHVCRAADSKWLLTQTMSLLLHQTKLVFKGKLSPISDGGLPTISIKVFCLHQSPSASQCIFSHLNFTPHNIFTPTYTCNWHQFFFFFYKTLLFPVYRASNWYLCTFPGRKLFGNSHFSQVTR